MLDRCAQISGWNSSNKGDNRVQIIGGHFDGFNRRWTGRVKGICNILNLRKGSMGLEDIESLKPCVPIRKSSQNRERGRRSDVIHPVGVAHNVTASTKFKRKCLTRNQITGNSGGRYLGLLFFSGSKCNARIILKAFNRAPAYVRCQPFLKPFFGFCINTIQIVSDVLTGKYGAPFGGHLEHKPVAFFYLNACLHRKAWQDMLKKAAILQKLGGCQVKTFLVCGNKACSEGQ